MEIYFVFFLPPAKKEERNPAHIAAHLQTRTSRRSNQWFAKELQFCLRTPAKLLHLCFELKL